MTAVVIGIITALVYDITFAAAACYPHFVDPIGVAMAFPQAALDVGFGAVIAVFVVLAAATRLLGRGVTFRTLSLAALIIAICVAALLGYANHPHDVPCAI